MRVSLIRLRLILLAAPIHLIIVFVVALIVIIVIILIVFLTFRPAGLRIRSHRSRTWPSTLERRYSASCRLENILEHHGVNLAADLVKESAKLLRIHILHVLHVSEHLGLIGEHLGCHASDECMLVHVVAHLVIVAPSVLPVLIIVVLAISMAAIVAAPSPALIIIIIVSVPVVIIIVTVSVVVVVGASITLVVLGVMATLARLIVGVVASTPLSVVVLSGAVRVPLLVVVVMLAVIWTASIPRRSRWLLGHIRTTTRRLKSRLRGCGGTPCTVFRVLVDLQEVHGWLARRTSAPSIRCRRIIVSITAVVAVHLFLILARIVHHCLPVYLLALRRGVALHRC